jgi:hypothetical protein
LKDGVEAKLETGKTTLKKQDFSTLNEFSVSKEELEKYKVGDDIGIEVLEDGSIIGIEGVSK